MKLYVIRHGQSENNLIHRHSGWSKTPLTEKGKEDGRRAGRVLAQYSIEKIYTSSLPRTIQTCQSALPGREFETLDLVREINVGSLQDRLVADCQKDFGDFYSESRMRGDYTPWGGEDLKQVRKRAEKFLQMLEKSSYESVAVFTHGVFSKCIQSVVDGDPEKYPDSIPGNGCVAVYEYSEGAWKMLEWNRAE